MWVAESALALTSAAVSMRATSDRQTMGHSDGHSEHPRGGGADIGRRVTDGINTSGAVRKKPESACHEARAAGEYACGPGYGLLNLLSAAAAVARVEVRVCMHLCISVCSVAHVYLCMYMCMYACRNTLHACSCVLCRVYMCICRVELQRSMHLLSCSDFVCVYAHNTHRRAYVSSCINRLVYLFMYVHAHDTHRRTHCCVAHKRYAEASKPTSSCERAWKQAQSQHREGNWESCHVICPVSRTFTEC
jgi:hypothetical protein